MYIARRLRDAKLPMAATLEDLWCDPARGIEKAAARTLATGQWTRAKARSSAVPDALDGGWRPYMYCATITPAGQYVSARNVTQTILAGMVGAIPALFWAVSGANVALSWWALAVAAGFCAAGLYAVSMLLMLRIPWLDQTFGGLGRVFQVHHVVGLVGFLLMLLHPLALALGALQSRPVLAFGLLWPDPSSAVVFSGWIALLLFSVFFVLTVERRVPFGLWRWLHRASALAYGVMVWHLVAAWSGSLASWVGMALVIIGAASYAHRLLVEDSSRRGLPYRVVEVQHRGPDIVDIVLEPLGKSLHFSAGQFVYLGLQDSTSYRACGELNPYTLTGHPADPRLHLSIKAMGDCTRHIQELTPGVDALIRGPFGSLFPARADAQPQVWIAGGMGVTPFLSRAATISPGSSIDIIYAAPSESSARYLEDLRGLTRDRPDTRLHTIFEDSAGLPNVDAIEARVGSLRDKHFMLAGPLAMVTALDRELRSRGVPASHIHSEEGVLR